MTRYKLILTLMLGAFAGTVGNSAMAVDKQTEALLSSRIKDPFGTAAPESAAQRTINISSNTKHINVERDEVIKFLVDGKSFTWHFDPLALGYPIFELAAIAPKDVNVGKLVVYVQRSNFSPEFD